MTQRRTDKKRQMREFAFVELACLKLFDQTFLHGIFFIRVLFAVCVCLYAFTLPHNTFYLRAPDSINYLDGWLVLCSIRRLVVGSVKLTDGQMNGRTDG